MNGTLLRLWIATLALLLTSAVAAYVPDDRWTVTASGATGGEGTPITLTWSIVSDGTNIPGEGSSDLIDYFDDLFNVSSSSSNLTTRPWFQYFQQSFDRWDELGGITFVYEPSDNGSQLQTSGGALGVRGDVRIGGAFIDGGGDTLAYTWLPNSGDVVVDTGETSFYSNSSNNYRRLRNTIMHELGHAFGLLHIESSTDALLMEPFINTAIDGPQLDDIRGIQGLYGDAYEKTNGGLGNGTYLRATSLGNLTIGGSLSIGSDAIDGQSVGPQDTDFVSIANESDTDFYSFTIAAPTLLETTLTPLGGVFNQGVEGGPQSSFDANARNDLTLAVFASNGTTLLGSANLTGAGGTEMLSGLELSSAGTYYARVTGSSTSVQLYELELTASLLSIALPGDFNGDGVVNAADYTVWRNQLGAIGQGLTADGNGDGMVGNLDYADWAANFGNKFPPPGAGAAVPEPTALVLVLISLCGWAAISKLPRRFTH